MNIDLGVKLAIVTGSTSGIGLGIARGLASAGAEVVVTGRRQDNVDKAIATLRAELPEALLRGVAADLATAEGSATLINAVPQADILINNLGIYGGKPLFELEDSDWDRIFQVNVTTAARLSKHYAPAMRDKGWGRLMFISSESALNVPLEMVHYGASKAAMQALSRGYAKALAGTGVTVNTILPGRTRTDGVVSFLAGLAKERNVPESEAEEVFLMENRPTTLLRRFSTTEEVANLCVYVASELSAATTGSALRVDGGIVDTIS